MRLRRATAAKIKARDPATGGPTASGVFGAKVLELVGKWLWSQGPNGGRQAQSSELLPFVETKIEDLLFPPATNELDLRTAPGFREPGRHDPACRLIGAHLGRGEDPAAVRELAHEWNKRNSPPLDRDELDRIVTDLAKKDAARLAPFRPIEAMILISANGFP